MLPLTVLVAPALAPLLTARFLLPESWLAFLKYLLPFYFANLRLFSSLITSMPLVLPSSVWNFEQKSAWVLLFKLILEALYPMPGLKSLSPPWCKRDLAVTVLGSVVPNLGSMPSEFTEFRLWNEVTTICYTFGVCIEVCPRLRDLSFSFLACWALASWTISAWIYAELRGDPSPMLKPLALPIASYLLLLCSSML